MTAVSVRQYRLLLGLLTAALLFAVATPLEAQSCGWSTSKTPSRAADPELWNGLEPIPVTNDRDTTFFDRNGGYDHNKPFWRAVDVVDGSMFSGYNLGLQIWDVSGSYQATPKRLSTFKIDTLPILFRNPHDYFLVTDVDVPDDNSNLAVMTGWDAMGMVVLDTSDKSRPRVLYQDGGASGTKYGQGAYATKIGGRYYGFMAAQRFTGNGLWMYDLTKAQEVGAINTCAEARPGLVNPACTGASLGKLSDSPLSHVDGAGSSTLGHFVVASGGAGGVTGLEIWNVSTPTFPKLALTGFAGRRVDGVAMWVSGNKIYLGVGLRGPDEGRIYDVTCLKSGSSCGANNPLDGNPVYSFPATGAGVSTRMTVSHSVSNGVPYLYFGFAYSYYVDALQVEWLLNVTDPANPVELAGGDPKNGNLGQPTINLEDGTEVGYWSWYYACNLSGSNSFEPADGRVYDGYFYRAGSSILDVHKLKDVTPRISVAPSANQTYQGTPITATATALNCTPSALGWTWSAPGGVISGTGSSVQVSWSSTGAKTVSAANSACVGATVTPAAVQVISAAPTVGSVTSDVSALLVCSPATFQAQSVAGRPPLSTGWEILGPGDTPLTSPTLTLSNNGQTAVWDTSTDQPAAGSYKARFTASNDVSSASATSAPVVVTAPGSLGFTAPIGAAVSFGTVAFQANATGATEWRWDFGDGDTLQTLDPVTGPAPEHAYDAIGIYDVTVEIRNCIDDAWQTSAILPLEIVEINPLEITTFQARSIFGFYFYDTGQPITFQYAVSGDPDFYDYDWNGDGTFEDAGNTTPATTHAYSQAGDYRPVLRVRRGTAEKTKQHLQILQVSSGKPAAISVSGPTSGLVSTAYSFAATASNCTPTAGGWSWTASGGGTVSGSGSSISVTWSTTGLKIVTASNSACGAASGSRSISVRTDTPPPPPPPTNLDARFSFGPASPKVGDMVSFDGSTSLGTPTSFSWKFGDGDTATGDKVLHAFDAAGTYQVELEVAKADLSCSFGYCTDTVVKSITVTSDQPVQGSNGCLGDAASDDKTLCLMDGRFQLRVKWRDQHNGNRTGEGGALRYGESDVTGFFWFFNKNNVELVVKVLDATNINDNIWIFYGGLSDVYYELEVTDTESGDVRTYENLEGSICGRADTGAFTVAQTGALNTGALHAAPLTSSGSGLGSVTAAAFRPDDSGDVLALLDGRFEVTVDWENQHDDNAPGTGHAIPGTEKSGYFWFFNPTNLELVVKMIDARSVSGYFWVFWGGLSDVKYTIHILDTVTGDEWTRTNPAGSLCGGGDTTAFQE